VLKEYLNDYRTEIMHKLATTADTVEIHRLQGKLMVIEDLVGLRGEVVKYVKGLSDGTMKKIEIGGLDGVSKK
jgi:hypothetical protein